VRVRDHVVISAVGAVLAVPLIGRGALGLWAGGVLIDVDHYAWFCLRQRNLNPSAAVRFFNEADPPQHSATRALHTPAALLGISLLGLRKRSLLPVAVGMGLHAALDSYHVAQLDRARSAALARDGHTCRVCGTEALPVEAHLWRQPGLLPSYRVQNLISLCGRCHDAAHEGLIGPPSWT
jgi:hypothetical protein